VIVDDAWGVIHLTLSQTGYRWSFLSADRGQLDAGEAACH
jgi:hypothetical protein